MSGPEYRFQEEVVSFLENLCGYDVCVMSQPKPWLGTPGLPDLYVRHPELETREWIELKAPGGSHGLTDHQRLWHEGERACGGKVMTITSYEELEDWCAERGFEIEVSA